MPARVSTQRRADSFFALYYELGPERSLEKLHKKVSDLGLYNYSVKTLKRWSSDYHWQSRIAVVDANAREVEDKSAAATILKMNERQAGLGRSLQLIAQSGIKHFTDQCTDPVTRTLKGMPLAIQDITRLVDAGVKVERLASGEVTSRHEIVKDTVNAIVVKIGLLFNEVNLIEDPEERSRVFARKGDAIIDAETEQLIRGV